MKVLISTALGAKGEKTMFEGLTIVMRAVMVAGIPVMAGALWAEVLDLWEIWKEEHPEWKR